MEAMMEPNIPLLRKVVEWVEWQDQLTEGKEWYQGNWFYSKFLVGEVEWCDTAMCIAGKVATDAGWVPKYRDGFYDTIVIKDGARRLVWDVAAELLGVEQEAADTLFNGDNDAHDIRRIAEEIAGERL